jgi:MFS transporter, DHA2 family, multidrug resistance protein
MSAAAAAPGRADGVPHRGIITVSIMLAAGMQSLDNTIANVALPRIQGSLSSTQEQMSWVLTSYIVAAAIMIPLTGWLSDRLGRRRVFVASILGFTLASAFCGMAQSLPQIVFARLLQGIFGAALMPMSQAVLLDINPPERHAKAMSVLAMGVVVGPILGPALGGWLTEQFSWRWVFFINVPTGVLGLFGVLAFMPETRRLKSRFDFFGFASLSVAIGALQLLLDRGQSNDWFSATETWIEVAAAGLAMYLFIVHVTTTRDEPFVSLALFRDRNFLTGSLFMGVVAAVLFSTLALLPPLLQGLMNYSVELTGLITAPRGVGAMVALFVVPWLMKRFDVRWIIAAGFLMTAASLWQMTGFSLQMDVRYVVYTGVLQGLGLGVVYVPFAAIAFATLPAQLRNQGAAIFSLARNMGSSIGISIVTVLLTRNMQVMHARLAEHVTPFGDGLGASSLQAVSSAQGLAQIEAMVRRQAAMLAYNSDFQLLLVLSLCVVPLVLILRPTARGQDAEPTVIE